MACLVLVSPGLRPESYRKITCFEMLNALFSKPINIEDRKCWIIMLFQSKTSLKAEAPVEIMIDDELFRTILLWYWKVPRAKMAEQMAEHMAEDRKLPFFFAPKSKDFLITMEGPLKIIQSETGTEYPYTHIRKMVATTIREVYSNDSKKMEDLLRAEGHSSKTVDKYYDVHRQQRLYEQNAKVKASLGYKPSQVKSSHMQESGTEDDDMMDEGSDLVILYL